MEAPPPPSNAQRGAFPFSRGLALRACMWYNIRVAGGFYGENR